jgi:hypothetical protein
MNKKRLYVANRTNDSGYASINDLYYISDFYKKILIAFSLGRKSFFEK